METRLRSGTLDILDGTRVGAVNFWERDGRFTAKLVLPERNLILGEGDEFVIEGINYRVKALEEGKRAGTYELVIEGPDKEKVPAKKEVPEQAPRLKESDFRPEEKVTCLFQSATYELGGVRTGLRNFGNREGRLSAYLNTGKGSQLIFLHDEFDLGVSRFRLLAIQRTESGNFREAFLKEIGPAHHPVDLAELAQELKKSRILRQERAQKVRDHTFKIPRRQYPEILKTLEAMTPEILTHLSPGAEPFSIEKWVVEMKSEMITNPREGDLGPNTIETKRAIITQAEVEAFTRISITRWSPTGIANLSVRVFWRVGNEQLDCSLHCDPDGEAHEACLMGQPSATALVKKFLLAERG